MEGNSSANGGAQRLNLPIFYGACYLHAATPPIRRLLPARRDTS